MSLLMMDDDKPKSVLITGVAGFIGSHLADKCLSLGWDVVGIDNFSTGNESNVAHLRKKNNFHLFPIDVRQINSIPLNQKFDVILHQAALGSVPRSITEPEASLENNVNGFLAILEFARKNKIPKVVYASSSSVYGDSKHDIKFIGEEGEPLSPYAVSKKVNEDYAKVYSKCYGIKTIGLRYFNVYGPRQNPNGTYAAVIPKWIDLIKKGKPITIYGNGIQQRDFTFVKDVVLANMQAVICDNDFESAVLNIGTGIETNLNYLAKSISKNMGKECIINYESPRKGDVHSSRAAFGNTTKMIGYFPTYNVNMGLSDMLGDTSEHLTQADLDNEFKNVKEHFGEATL